ncbi:MAG: GAF domain-containing protein [Acidimicrobiia bacterium]|nr:GAF domain-containing protein [Acidimicrobiia bacterium]
MAVQAPSVTRHLPRPAIVFRWASLALAVALAIGSQQTTAWAAIEAGAVAIALVAAQTMMERWTFRYRGVTEAVILVEVGVTTALVAYTGQWSSPFLLFAFAPVLDAGFLSGLRAAVAVSLLATLAPTLVSAVHEGGVTRAIVTAACTWGFAYVVSGGIAAYARRQAVALATTRSLLADERQETARRVETLEDANELLVDLHEVAQQLPATLDLEGLVNTTLDRLGALFPVKTSAVLLLEDDTALRVLGCRGAVLTIAPIRLDTAPAPLRLAIQRPVAASHTPAGDPLDDTANSLLYVPLRREGRTLGLLVLEDTEPERFGGEDISLLTGFAGPVSVALENALLFTRLRTLATSEERARIARELHDRTAQHLAFIAFELDRLGRQARKVAQAELDARSEAAATVTAPAPAEALNDEIDGLATEIRSAIEDLRETIGDLRTDVTESKGLADLIREHVTSVAARTGLTVDLQLPASGVRLPLPQERELWRICQEAVGNVVKHSGAGWIGVSLQVDHESAELRIEDNGAGFDPRVRKPGHFGLAGMSERATAIGARFSVDGRPSGGTSITVTLRRNA